MADNDDTLEGASTSVTVAETPRRRERQAARAEIEGPARLGHFQLLELLGRGGMGAVYSAYDLDLDRKVAIKVLAEDSATNERAVERNQRLLREAQAMAKLSHPNVVPVYEVGTTDDGVFIAMEYVDGGTLATWLGGDRPWRAIVGVFEQAARGLAAAHDAGIVHRDFKPANVLVDDHGRVRVMDFGIALVAAAPPERAEAAIEARAASTGDVTPASSPSHPSSVLTDAGVLVGTPAYMSPEQHRGASVDARSDQFSFCIALWEALYGKRPFAGKRKELADNVIAGRITKPDVDVKRAPAWVVAIMTRGLATDPAQRFASMTELADALANDPGRRRARIAIGAGGAVAVAAIAAIVGWSARGGGVEPCSGFGAKLAGAWDEPTRAAIARAFAASNIVYAPASEHRVEQLLDRYRDQWLAARTEVCRVTRNHEQAERVVELETACLDRRLGELRALTAVLASSADASAIERAVEAASTLTPVVGCSDTGALLVPDRGVLDPAARARRTALAERLDRATAQLRVDHDKEVLAAAPALVTEATAIGDNALIAEALELHGIVLDHTGDHAHAETVLEDALRRARLAGDTDRFVSIAIDLVGALSNLSIVKGREALGIVRVAQTAVEDARDPMLPVRLIIAHGSDLLALGRPAEAKPLLEEAIDRAKHSIGGDHVLVFRAQLSLAAALGMTAGWSGALPIFDQLVTGTTRTLGPLHPLTIASRLERCHIMSTADIDSAVACYDAVLPDADRVLGRRDHRTLNNRVNLGVALHDAGKHAAARALLAQTLADVPAGEGADRWVSEVDLARTLGQCELLDGDYAAALEHCQLAAKGIGIHHKALDVETCLGEAELGLGHAAQALAALESLESLTPDSDIEGVGAWRFAYARAVWAGRHDLARARALGQQAVSELGKSLAWRRDPIALWLAKLPKS